MKLLKLLGMLAVVAGLFAAAYGAAASISVTSDDLGAGSADVDPCAQSASVSYTVQWDTSDNRYEVTGVTVDAPGCADDAAVNVQLTDQDGAGIGEASGTITGGTTGPMPVSPQPAAAAVEDVHVVINGG